jgi:Ca2+-binding RTX toxin-like protein
VRAWWSGTLMPVVRAARRALPAALVLALGLLVPAGAQAAATMSVSGSTLTFSTSDGLDHETYPYLGSNGHLRIDDPGGITLGASGCTSVSAGVVDCGAPSAFTRLVLSFGAGNDTMAVRDGLHLAVTVDGGAGDDEIDGGDQGDVLDGGDGADTVYGNAGADVVRGGPGDDEISGGTGIDTLDGGGGNDAVGAWTRPPMRRP